MSTELWFRNPDNYIRELVEQGCYRVAWDRGYLSKRSIDPLKHAELYFGHSFPWRVLLIGPQGTAEYKAGDEVGRPTAVYPTWSYGEDAMLLEEMVAEPAGDDVRVYGDETVERELRPVQGQRHMVVITDLPDSKTGAGKSFLAYLKTLQEDYPDVTLYVHGLYSYRLAFGMGFKAADMECREVAKRGKVILSSGKEIKFEQAAANPTWVTNLGFKPVDLKIPRVRCMFNIKSACWAAENYAALFNFRTSGGGPVDTETPDAEYKAPETKSPIVGKAVAVAGDKQICNTCSLQDKCKYYRDGAVCTVPGAETRSLAQMFKTRDSGQIVEALSTIVAAGATRLERGMRVEEAVGDLDPEVTKTMNQIFSQGVQLAKLLDPSLRGGPKVAVNVGVGQGGTANIAVTNPKDLAAAAIQALVAQGIKREDITPKMIETFFAGMANPEAAQKAIESPVVGEIVRDKSA